MSPHVALTLPNGVKIVVPDRLTLLTPYVLIEQQDWFEDEIRFLRRVLGEGQKLIDVGANYGMYTLSLAKEVGPGGRVWAFEPSTSTADMLERGVAANGFGQVVVTRCALSDAPGKARFSNLENSEFNALNRDGGSPDADTEEVEVDTLDRCLERWNWEAMDFLKLDAEGEEARILDGGRVFFERLSPLVLYEIKADGFHHIELLRQFEALGYRSFRLAPGPGVLIPFGPGDEPDAFLLNLFACKPDRSARLRDAGVLVERRADGDTPATTPLARHHWTQALAGLPYGRLLSPQWSARVVDPSAAALDRALALHACSVDPTLDATTRLSALSTSYRLLREACASRPPGVCLSSLGRVAAELGERQVAVDSFETLIQHLLEQGSFDPSEPFLAPRSRFDLLDPQGKLGDWFVAGLLEARETLGAYSTYYTGGSTLPRLQEIIRLGFASPEMKRRLRLVTTVFGAADSKGAPLAD
jgi:FkbM family methyltransferase